MQKQICIPSDTGYALKVYKFAFIPFMLCLYIYVISFSTSEISNQMPSRFDQLAGCLKWGTVGTTALAGWSILKIGPLGGKLAIIPLDTREGFKNRRRLCVLIFCYGYCLKESYPESRVWYFWNFFENYCNMAISKPITY